MMAMWTPESGWDRASTGRRSRCGGPSARPAHRLSESPAQLGSSTFDSVALYFSGQVICLLWKIVGQPCRASEAGEHALETYGSSALSAPMPEGLGNRCRIAVHAVGGQSHAVGQAECQISHELLGALGGAVAKPVAGCHKYRMSSRDITTLTNQSKACSLRSWKWSSKMKPCGGWRAIRCSTWACIAASSKLIGCGSS